MSVSKSSGLFHRRRRYTYYVLPLSPRVHVHIFFDGSRSRFSGGRCQILRRWDGRRLAFLAPVTLLTFFHLVVGIVMWCVGCFVPAFSLS